MSNQRCTPEFKDEAFQQVLEQGYSVPDVSKRLGVSAHSLYKWVDAIKPIEHEAQANELLDAKSEILRLRAGEERDILKKTACAQLRQVGGRFLRLARMRPRKCHEVAPPA